MAEAESKKPPDARRHGENFVAKLVPDPAKPPDLMRLAGYRGASSQAGYVRLYANPELSIWFDIPEGDILYEQPVPTDVDPLGAVALWVKRDSKMISSLTQQAQGGQQPMSPFTQTAAAQPQATFPTTVQPTPPITLTHTIPYTITPLCHSPQFFCPPHSFLAICPPTPGIICPPSPLAICQVSPLPICAQPVSPTCPPTQPPTTIGPTTIPTATIQTGGSFAPGVQAAAPQALTQTGAAQQILPTLTIHPSILVQCTIHSLLVQCTIHHSPTPICVIPVSPTCTPFTPGSIPTSIPTSEPGSLAAGSGLAAAPQAFTAQPFVPGGVNPNIISPPPACFSPVPICFRPPSPPIFQCTPPHSLIWWLCHPTPITPVSPVTPVTPVSPPTSFAGGGVGAAQQAFTITPVTLPTHGTIQTLPTPNTISVTSIATHPTIPTIPTVHPTVTVTVTPVTPVTFA